MLLPVMIFPFSSHQTVYKNIRTNHYKCRNPILIQSCNRLTGQVFTSGAGTYGQLGHGSVQNDYLPRMVAELMGTICTQISTGRRHTLTFVPSRGRIYGFGLGCSGQLGNRSAQNSSVPQVVVGMTTRSML